MTRKRTNVRDAATGRYVEAEEAERRPRETMRDNQAEDEQREVERMLYRLCTEWKRGIVRVQLNNDWFSISVWDGAEEIAFERAVLPPREVIEICYEAAFGVER